MNTLPLTFGSQELTALGEGALYWPSQQLLVVSDLHLGKSDRIARRSGQMLPPYESADTLQRLKTVIDARNPKTVVCLGDSFDDLTASETLDPSNCELLHALMVGRRWIWIEGNHDPGPSNFRGKHLQELELSGIIFRHIAQSTSQNPEISGHYHPKTRINVKGRVISRPSFILNAERLIMPSFGTYTGGLYSDMAPLSDIFKDGGHAILTGSTPHKIPLRTSGR